MYEPSGQAKALSRIYSVNPVRNRRFKLREAQCAEQCEAAYLSVLQHPPASLHDRIKIVRFEWDDTKARSNLQKHGVSFDEACTLFEDPLYIILADPDHSQDENRLIVVGESTNRGLLVVSYIEARSSTRLIGAREAIRSEREFYEEDS